jgi:sensor domain CHASE-containing protein
VTPALGVVEVDGRLPLIAADPILHSDGSGPAAGTFVTGRWLDAAEVSALGTRTHHTMSVLMLSDPIPEMDAPAVAEPSST